MKLNDSIYIKHLKWCLANRKHSQRLSYFSFIILLQQLLLLLVLLLPHQRKYYYDNYCYYKNNKQLIELPSPMGPCSKENNACQSDLREVEGRTGIGIAPEIVFHETQCVPGTVSRPCWPPTTHLCAFSYHIQDHITSPHLTDSFYKNWFTSLK